MFIGILADDMTGAVDSALAFWERAIPSTILLDIAGKGIADARSMIEAIRLAAQLAHEARKG